jgi:hypothetical protein
MDFIDFEKKSLPRPELLQVWDRCSLYQNVLKRPFFWAMPLKKNKLPGLSKNTSKRSSSVMVSSVHRSAILIGQPREKSLLWFSIFAFF